MRGESARQCQLPSIELVYPCDHLQGNSPPVSLQHSILAINSILVHCFSYWERLQHLFLPWGSFTMWAVQIWIAHLCMLGFLFRGGHFPPPRDHSDNFTLHSFLRWAFSSRIFLEAFWGSSPILCLSQGSLSGVGPAWTPVFLWVFHSQPWAVESISRL